MIDRPSAALGNVRDSEEVEAQVGSIIHRFAPGHDLDQVQQTFQLLRQAFDGKLAGYAGLKTGYHNAMHTNEVVLCTSRMLHGLHLAGHGLDAQNIDAALIGALLHDSGYLMNVTEAAVAGSTGAQFTATHVNRGVEFARNHLTGLADGTLSSIIKVIQLTDHRQHPDWVKFDNPQQQLAAFATATADLVGQMANREYLERLLFLYLEFKEAGLGGFSDTHELLEKSGAFYRMTRDRLDRDLGGMTVQLARHFSEATGESRNFYMESIDRNLAYLEHVVSESRSRRLELLKRGGVVEQLGGDIV